MFPIINPEVEELGVVVGKVYGISTNKKLSEDFIREFKDKVYWSSISVYQKLSEDFIREFKDEVSWDYISSNQKLSEDFIREMKDYVDWDDILYLDNPEAVLKKGTPITIVYGPYKDRKGYLLRIRRDRKVVMQLAGVVAIALSGIPIEHIKVDEE